MAALFLAVPVVTGQLVLGAKAGAASLVGNMIGGVSSEAGRAAGGGFSSDATQRARGAFAAIGQTAYLKGLRQAEVSDPGSAAGGAPKFLAGRTLAMQNYGRMHNMEASLAGQMREFYGAKGNFIQGQFSETQAAIGLARAGVMKEGGNVTGVGDIGGLLHGLTSGGGGGGKLSGFAKGGLAGLNLGGKGYSAFANPQANWALAQDEYALNKAFAAASKENYGAQFQAAVDTYKNQALAEGFNSAGQRLGAQAEFAGQSAAWAAKNDYTHATAGDLAAMGVSQLDAGSKPQTFEGAAMMGMLDSDLHTHDKFLSRADENGNQVDASVSQLAHFGDKEGGFSGSDAHRFLHELDVGAKLNEADGSPGELSQERVRQQMEKELGLKNVAGLDAHGVSQSGFDYNHYTGDLTKDGAGQVTAFLADLYGAIEKQFAGQGPEAAQKAVNEFNQALNERDPTTGIPMKDTLAEDASQAKREFLDRKEGAWEDFNEKYKGMFDNYGISNQDLQQSADKSFSGEFLRSSGILAANALGMIVPTPSTLAANDADKENRIKGQPGGAINIDPLSAMNKAEQRYKEAKKRGDTVLHHGKR
jgi:hypothetical protein